MAKRTKIWLICALCLILVGGLVFVGGLASMDFDFTLLSSTQYTTSTYQIQEPFQKIILDVDLSHVELLPSADNTCKIVSKSAEKITHQYFVKDDTLFIRELDARKWHDYIGVNLGSPKITVHLPVKDYEAISIEVDTGNVVMNEIYATKMVIETDTGDVKLNACDGAQIFIETEIGDVTGTLRSGKLFLCSSDTGDIHVPKSEPLGQCEIETDTGDIEIRIAK
ncbi:MAG: DUF4097 family beta strand repeat protein [Oscillospiraceae bacterium]|nr:DUF4097 family beta strand repeat protein [Oscillospiraceae bacterium]